jgi:hypothetical protein
VKDKNINKIVIIILNINKNNINTSRTLSDIFSFNINDLKLFQIPPHWNIIFLPSSLNIPCGLRIINLDNGKNLSEKKITAINNNNLQSINHKVDVLHSFITFFTNPNVLRKRVGQRKT